MSYPTRYAATPRGPYSGLREGYEALLRKKEATLTGGAYAREARPGVTTSCAAANRSIWAAADGVVVRSAPLGMGFVQGLLAILTGAVQTIAWDTTASYGQLRLAGVSSAETYTMTFDDTRTDYLLLGGFVNGPAYQAAIMGLVIRWLQRDTNAAGSREVLHAWWQLVAALEALSPRPSGQGAWSREQVKAACQPLPENARVRAALERTADALCFALKHPLPTVSGRSLFVQYDTALPAGVVLAGGADGTVLLTLPPAHAGTPAPALAGADPAADHDSDLDLDRPEAEPAGFPAPPAAEPTVLPPPPPAGRRTSHRAPAAGPTSAGESVAPAGPAGDEPPAIPPLVGAALGARVDRAFTRPGDVFLFGVTATGKTSWAKHAAISHGFGLEIVVFKPGLKDEMLYGSLVQRDGGWCWQDGPIVRAARRAAVGERVVLLLDELPRGDKSIVAGTMELMNTYAAADLVAQCLPVPALPGPYRVIRISDTQETLVVAASRLKLIATANLGDRYGGLDLADPAFRRRWTGGWMELAGYTESETAAILAAQLALPVRHPLIVALMQVDAEVQAYQRKEDALVMTTNLAVLLNWGQEVLRQLAQPSDQYVSLAGGPALSPAVDSTQAFITAAQDLWIDMMCPLAGARRDPDVYRAILAITERHAPGRF